MHVGISEVVVVLFVFIAGGLGYLISRKLSRPQS